MSSPEFDQPYESENDETAVDNEELQHEASPAENEQHSEPDTDDYEPRALSSVSLDLTVRSGGVTLTLEALQKLAPGSVVEVTGITPGYATLCHGERVIAEGELVDVDGRLGLQITRMIFDR